MAARTLRALLTSVICALALTAFSAIADAQWPASPGSKALRFFEAHPAADADVVLRELRPPPAGVNERLRAVSVLPEKGELHPDCDERAKLSMVEAVLVYHERADVFETKLIDLPLAVVALHERTVLLISRPALRLVSGAELQALAAHEIGHDYFWTDFDPAGRDGRGRQELELKCDGIALLTLVALGLDPGLLVEAVRKLTRFNEMLGTAADDDQYPHLYDRERFVNVLRDRILPRNARATSPDDRGTKALAESLKPAAAPQGTGRGGPPDPSDTRCPPPRLPS
jgi:hypothetical protein